MTSDSHSLPPTGRSRDAIVLIGYRGCGKTTVGRFIAVQLGWRHVDVDDEIEARAGRSVAEIFASEGEAAFRRLEAAVLARLDPPPGCVVSVGGGAVADAENRACIRRLGFCAWLTAPLDTILARLAADPRSAALRPPLTTADPADEVRQKLAERLPLYAELADIAVATEGRSVSEVGRAVLTAWRSAAGVEPS